MTLFALGLDSFALLCVLFGFCCVCGFLFCFDCFGFGLCFALGLIWLCRFALILGGVVTALLTVLHVGVLFLGVCGC